ncbi:MAG: hypothetical protein LUF92_04230 [Clostridiales bacterium]|nr:hypothetical protein [Clostridiales bacterium]
MKKRRRINHRKKISQILMLICIAVLLVGCRPSPVLEQIIYTKDADITDFDQEQLNPEDQAQEDERFSNEEKDDAETERDTAQTASVEEDEGDDDSSSSNVEYNENGDSSLPSASSGDSSNDSNSGGSGSSGSGNSENDDDDSDDDSSGDDTNQLDELDSLEDDGSSSEDDVESDDEGGDTDTGDENEDANGGGTGGSGSSNKKTVTDGNGEEQEIPEDVETVAAAGAAAILVEMVGGTGRLVGTSESITQNNLAQTLCADIKNGSVKTWWDDDGSEPMSNSAFNELLVTKPQVCFEISGENTFSSEQIAKLAQEDIVYMAPPSLSSTDNLIEAVQIVAEVLDYNETTGKSASAIVQSYSSWVSDCVNNVPTPSSNMYSLFVAEWRDDISYTFGNSDASYLPVDSDGSGSGVAIAWSPAKDELVSTFMNAAGVTNESTVNQNLDDTEGVYVAPMFHQLNATFSSNEYTYYDSNIASMADWFVTHRITDSSYVLLGNESYPAIIVADESVKSSIESNWYWQYHGRISVTGVDWSAGYASEIDSNKLFFSSICGDYEIYVAPTGTTAWADGSVESPLLSYWVANKITGRVNTNTLKSKVKSFYSEFFGVSLSDSQLEEIID